MGADPVDSTARLRLLVVTSLFGLPWDPTRAMFNQQQFDRLARQADLTVLVAVPWPMALRRWRTYRQQCRAARERWPYVDYFVYGYLPGFARALHVPMFLTSLLLQRFRTLFRRRWDCLLGSWAYPDAVATQLLGRAAGVPVLAKVHGTDVNVYTQSRWLRWQIRAGLAGAQRVIAVSRALAQRLVAIGVPGDRIEVIYNGVDDARFHPLPKEAARTQLGLPLGEPVVLYVGNLLLSKGCADLLEGFARMARGQPAAHLVMVGDGAARSALAQRASELGLGERVRLAGKVPHADLVRWFAAADLLALVSHNEGVPNVVLEAMACGRPVVATRVGGIAEVLPAGAGRLVEVGDLDGIAAALSQVLAARWDEQAIVAHARGFSWSRNVERVLQLARESAAQPSSAGRPRLRPRRPA